ncbi:Ig-like domain-containing protein [Spongiivirga citrea]|uniref:SbsA Ig-like domain-containing protein n=1 Tax=Spongiivirga citrea TaxID=1481457 RepID=A0A6M0CFB4_9FLAO|nr:Ig-like domain-containing protein [Spongiivirga citrea]NER16535.1 hypothetical protein [Spongiivirga citrea]
MDVGIHNMFKKKIKFVLVFFCLGILFSCSNNSKETEVEVNYEQQKALSISFKNKGQDSDLKVYRKSNKETAILGDFTTKDGITSFTPIIPFSSGNEYVVYSKDRLLSSFTIQSFENELAKLLAIYPTTDNVPENLLKIYLVFSQPMEEVGKALDHIKVMNTNTGKEASVFLDLQPELWNKDHTQLTLWLDPGRIKTGLIPNRESGLPILKGNTYKIIVDKNWKTANGRPLDKDYIKQLNVEERDATKLDPNSWSLKVPKVDTKNPLTITFTETLDAILLKESFSILDNQGVEVEGEFVFEDKETVLLFNPINKWNVGAYNISIASKLEDLAGNNLNHLFDQDITDKNVTTNSSGSHKELSFEIL